MGLEFKVSLATAALGTALCAGSLLSYNNGIKNVKNSEGYKNQTSLHAEGYYFHNHNARQATEGTGMIFGFMMALVGVPSAIGYAMRDCSETEEEAEKKLEIIE